MANKLKYHISYQTIKEIRNLKAEGVTDYAMEKIFNIPRDVINSRLRNNHITDIDRIASDIADIKRAEELLITMPRDHRYRSLLHYYATADLNNCHVHFTKQLLCERF